jgi:coenzyme F420 hydrogenase subunit beta
VRRTWVVMARTSWPELYREVVDTGLCTGCGACVAACPTGVLDYVDGNPVRDLAHPDACDKAARGCDICARICPRLRSWEADSDQALFGRVRTADEVSGISRDILLAQATDAQILERAQDGGLVSALVAWGLDSGRLDGAVLSRPAAGRPLEAEPFLARSRSDVLAAAGSRYSYSPSLLALREAHDLRLRRLAVVGVGCHAAVNGTATAHAARKQERSMALVIGLLCSKTFTHAGQVATLAEHGIDPTSVRKVNIKGRYIVQTADGTSHELPLTALNPHTRPPCNSCPDFAASLADISAGGIASEPGWTLTIVRTVRGERWIREAVEAGVLSVRSAASDRPALDLLERLARRSRARLSV